MYVKFSGRTIMSHVAMLLSICCILSIAVWLQQNEVCCATYIFADSSGLVIVYQIVCQECISRPSSITRFWCYCYTTSSFQTPLWSPRTHGGDLIMHYCFTQAVISRLLIDLNRAHLANEDILLQVSIWEEFHSTPPWTGSRTSACSADVQLNLVLTKQIHQLW